MRYRFIVFVYGLFLLAGGSQAQPMVEIIEQIDNSRMVAFVEQADIEAGPAWIPGASPIPLSVDAALQSISRFSEASGRADAIDEIEIRKVPGHEKRWHYLVKVADDRMTTRYRLYLVLMNGKVVPAIIEPEGYK